MPEPVQHAVSRVKGDMNELMDERDYRKVAPESDGPVGLASERAAAERFGADAVPLRSAAERDAESEKEERWRIVAAGSRRRSAFRRRRRFVLGLAIIGLVVLAVVRVTSGNTHAAQDPVQGTVAPSAGRTQSSENPAPLADAHAASRKRAPPRPARRRRRDARHRQRRSRSPDHQSQAHHPAPPHPTNEVASEPAPEPEAPPSYEPTPASEPAPEPEAAPPPESEPRAPPSTPEPTSSPENKTTERSQVEAQFGFEK
jgi:hypothetical protein